MIMRTMAACCLLLAIGFISACDSGSDPAGGDQPIIGFVTNGVANFWTIAEAGARKAAAEEGVRLEVRMPPKDDAAGNQKRMLEELLALQAAGIAVSPIDPDNQLDILNTVAERSILVTHDSDAPNSNRSVFVGVDNYTAGRMCGEMIEAALPDGGELMLFVGRIEQLNAKQRRQGIIDELLDRAPDPDRYDAPGYVLSGNGYKILDTRTDGYDQGDAKAQAEAAIVKHPELDLMVGLFAYNPPAILEALRGAGKLGQIQVIGFDEDDATLAGLADGHVYGTIVQDPYQYGYQSVRILAALARGDESVIPANGVRAVPARAIGKDDVAAFKAELEATLAEAKQ